MPHFAPKAPDHEELSPLEELKSGIRWRNSTFRSRYLWSSQIRETWPINLKRTVSLVLGNTCLHGLGWQTSILLILGEYLIEYFYKLWRTIAVFFINPLPEIPSDETDETSLSNTKHDQTEARTQISSHDTFYHKPLGPGCFSRLLLLKPALHSHSDLEGELIEWPYGIETDYFALSYCWGSPQLTKHIAVGGKKLYVTVNCHAALRKLRRRFIGQLVWVDAVCIDQYNLQEKSAQLQRMTTVYRNANQTIIYLGESCLTEAALKYLRLYGTVMRLPDIMSSLSVWLQHKIETKIYERRHGQVIAHLACHPWYQRVWTLQEFALARVDRTQLYCGSVQVPFDASGKFLHTLISKDTSPLLYDDILGTVATHKIRSELRKSFLVAQSGNTKLDVSRTLVGLQFHQVTEPRDHIYGLLAVFEHAGLPALPKPDYKKGVGLVYWEAMTTICRHQQSLLLLVLRRCPRNADMSNVPSWVPDFRAGPSRRQLMAMSHQASGKSQPSFAISANQRQMRMQVLIMDTITSSSEYVVERGRAQSEQQAYTVNDAGLLQDVRVIHQTMLAITDWLHILHFSQRSRNRYRDIATQFRVLLHHNDDAQDRFEDWLYLLVWADPLCRTILAQAERDSTSSPEEDPFSHHLEQFAQEEPEGYTQLFGERSPFHDPLMLVAFKFLFLLPIVGQLQASHESIMEMICGERFFITGEGYMGLGSVALQESDVIALIRGVPVPVILRKVGSLANTFQVVGTAHVQGIMKGEYWNDMDRMEEVVLV